MARRQCRDLFTAVKQERTRADEQRTNPLLDDSGEGRLDVALSVLALRVWTCSPRARAADCTSFNWPCAVGLSVFRR